MANATRLAKTLLPEHYDLHFDLDKQNLSFTGKVEIKLRKLKPSKRITLHSKDLQIDSVVLVRHDKKDDVEIAVTRINYHKSFNEVRLHTDHNLYPGYYTVKIAFKGKITAQMTGIYPSNFEHEDGTKDVIIGTQFESHHAREAFPCIDEPEAKAEFHVSLTTDIDDVVLSNMPIKSESTDNQRKTSVFEPTPVMSSYLLAFVAGAMHCYEAETKDGIKVRSWGAKSRPKNHLQYSVDEGVKILEFFTDYFGVPYPLPKLDQVALPDFDAGAMENWGLVTYREIALLADPENRSISNEQYVSLVVAHELSHQWFGNLVTMKWWDDLWLNESFASVMEHLALDVIHPDWYQWEYYTATDVISTSNRDIYQNIQPVSVKVSDPDLIETLFDPGIVYAKGARLLKMLREYIGDDAFRKGLSDYFVKHAYKNTTRDDLWSCLSLASGQDIGSLMTPWIMQPGLGLLRVDQKGTDIVLEQERYILDAKNDSTTWPIPLLANQDVTPDIIVNKKAKTSSKNAEYIVFNQFASGHYVTQYLQSDHKKYLAEKFMEATLPAEARINLLNDMLMLARRGDSSLTDALSLVVNAQNEARDNVWALIARVIGSANQLTEGNEKAEKLLRSFRRHLSSSQFESLGWDDKPSDDPNTKQMRHTMLSFMVGSEDQQVIKEALRRYETAETLEGLPAEIRNTILGTSVRHGDESIPDQLVGQYHKATPDVQLDITAALASTKNPQVAEKVLNQALGPKGFVRHQDVLRWIALFIRNHHTRDMAWDYMVKNWAWIEEVMGASKSFDYLPVYCASVVTTENEQARFIEFFQPKLTIKSLERNINVGMSDIAARVAWRQRDESKILEFLEKHFSQEL